MTEVTDEDRGAAEMWWSGLDHLGAVPGDDCRSYAKGHAVQRERAEKAEARLAVLEADLQGLGRGAFVVNGGGALDLLETARVNWQQAIDDCTTAETKRDESRAECKEKEAEITALLLQRIDLQTERDEARDNYETAHRAHADAVHDKHVALRECEQAEMACAKAERERGVAEKFADNMEKLRLEAHARAAELEAELQTAKRRIQQLDTPNHLKWNEGYDDGDG